MSDTPKQNDNDLVFEHVQTHVGSDGSEFHFYDLKPRQPVSPPTVSGSSGSFRVPGGLRQDLSPR
jgi:hypothetical protein